MPWELSPEIESFFQTSTAGFDQIMRLKGEIYRQLENRCTMRIQLGSRYYFIKQHFGVGWGEIFKNLLLLRLPIISAKNEYLALKRLKKLGVPTQEVVGFACRGINPARMKSFLITKELPQLISLEDFVASKHGNLKSFPKKRALINEVAHIAKTIHGNGINHRDFYICHFLLDLIKYPKMFLIDLHRAQLRNKTPKRWVIKDLAGLYFSSKEAGLTMRDSLRFIRAYHDKPLREILNKDHFFWTRVRKRGDKLFKKHVNRSNK